MGSDDDRRGAAYHEAGHAVVAWALGLQVGLIAITNEDDVRGRADIASDQAHLSQIDRLAICLAGLQAQEVFHAPLHDLAGLGDLAKVIELIGGLDTPVEQHRELRYAGYRRARELILQNEEGVARLADRLIERGRVTADEFIDLIKGT
jgi:ATP-dependent Zn protease